MKFNAMLLVLPGGDNATSTPLLSARPRLAHHPPLSSKRILSEICQGSQTLDPMGVRIQKALWALCHELRREFKPRTFVTSDDYNSRTLVNATNGREDCFRVKDLLLMSLWWYCI